MPPEPKGDDYFITLFLSAYEDGSWAGSVIANPDKIDRTKPAIDQHATRVSDGKTLAIEHTVIEPFVNDKSDYAAFEKAFLRIENDKSLLVPGLWIQVFVPVGALRDHHKKIAQDAAVESVHRWIRSNRLKLTDGMSEHSCAITGIHGRHPVDITLTVKVIPLQHGLLAGTGSLHIRRQQVEDNLENVIEKALRRKLPKLVAAKADKHILLLERQHRNLSIARMLDEIEKWRGQFLELAGVDEIWILETIFYGTDFGGSNLRFYLVERGDEVRSFDFNHGKLWMKSTNGVSEIVDRNLA